MSGVYVKQYTNNDGKVDVSKMLRILKYKMKVSKCLKEHIDSLEYSKPSDEKRKKRKQRHRSDLF